MDLQIYALCEELERNPLPEDPRNDSFCDSPPLEHDEHAMIESLDWQFKQLLETELLPVQVSPKGEASKHAELLRTKDEYIQLCVARLSNVRASMFKAINDESALIQLAARYYMEKEALVRRLGALVAGFPEGELPRDLQKLKDEDIASIFELPFGRERASRVSRALQNNTNGAVTS